MTEPSGVAYVGRKVLKNFPGHGKFFGTIEKFYGDRKSHPWLVQYEDGDSEDLRLHELLHILQPADTDLDDPSHAQVHTVKLAKKSAAGSKMGTLASKQAGGPSEPGASSSMTTPAAGIPISRAGGVPSRASNPLNPAKRRRVDSLQPSTAPQLSRPRPQLRPSNPHSDSTPSSLPGPITRPPSQIPPPSQNGPNHPQFNRVSGAAGIAANGQKASQDAHGSQQTPCEDGLQPVFPSEPRMLQSRSSKGRPLRKKRKLPKARSRQQGEPGPPNPSGTSKLPIISHAHPPEPAAERRAKLSKLPSSPCLAPGQALDAPGWRGSQEDINDRPSPVPSCLKAMSVDKAHTIVQGLADDLNARPAKLRLEPAAKASSPGDALSACPASPNPAHPSSSELSDALPLLKEQVKAWEQIVSEGVAQEAAAAAATLNCTQSSTSSGSLELVKEAPKRGSATTRSASKEAAGGPGKMLGLLLKTAPRRKRSAAVIHEIPVHQDFAVQEAPKRLRQASDGSHPLPLLGSKEGKGGELRCQRCTKRVSSLAASKGCDACHRAAQPPKSPVPQVGSPKVPAAAAAVASPSAVSPQAPTNARLSEQSPKSHLSFAWAARLQSTATQTARNRQPAQAQEPLQRPHSTPSKRAIQQPNQQPIQASAAPSWRLGTGRVCKVEVPASDPGDSLSAIGILIQHCVLDDREVLCCRDSVGNLLAVGNADREGVVCAQCERTVPLRHFAHTCAGLPRNYPFACQIQADERCPKKSLQVLIDEARAAGHMSPIRAQGPEEGSAQESPAATTMHAGMNWEGGPVEGGGPQLQRGSRRGSSSASIMRKGAAAEPIDLT
ncbi:hypothetical protein WJX84_007060 [Apatococcus fuscideae]|uniref:PTM/DIR17-like Tudor domain-containing protein n=1 Tax=Apatococcus fuscideae TaxID=2026836 RepID=A0AAW1T0N5_9CHLO